MNFQWGKVKILDTENIYYFDESCNIRVGRIGIKDNNEDLEKMFFTLGGIFLNKNDKLDRNEFLRHCNLPISIEKLKLRTLSKEKNFLEIMSSRKILHFLEYLYSNKIRIHYSILHIYSWALCDILTSFISNDTEIDKANSTAIFMYNQSLQSDLIEVLYCDFDNFHNLLVSYNFPAIPKNKITNFLEDILDLYTYNFETYFDPDDPKSFCKEMLRQIIKSNLKKNKLEDLSNQPLVLIDSFWPLYFSRAVEIKAKKVFDIEYKIMRELKSLKPNYEKQFNMKFIESKSCFPLQCSDVIVGIMSKFFSFLFNHTEKEISNKFKNLNDIQKQSLKLLNKLIDESNNRSFYLLVYIVPMFIRKREEFVYHLIDSFK